MKLELCYCTRTLLDEIKNPKLTQKDVALTYAMAICSSEETDWTTVNETLCKRWSWNGMLNVKRLAWKHINERERHSWSGT